MGLNINTGFHFPIFVRLAIAKIIKGDKYEWFLLIILEFHFYWFSDLHFPLCTVDMQIHQMNATVKNLQGRSLFLYGDTQNSFLKVQVLGLG